ncbi:MAG: phosphatidylglycerol lysyltransferase domain-containing protein [Firmicutes bacterium]|nr:phosphatidylglycerol lysyltransferase domain-containing protein [Bacillota bacterium]
MPEFKKIEIEDKKWIDKILRVYSCPNLEYNFTTMFLWQEAFDIMVAEEDGFLFIYSGKEENRSCLFPAGSGDERSAVNKLIAWSESKNTPLKFHSVNEWQKKFLEENFPGRFSFRETREDEDYVYESEKLKNLSGKKLSNKRNHINRFTADYPDWKYEIITGDNIYKAEEMHSKWCSIMDYSKKRGLLDDERVVKKAFKYYDELGLSGGILCAGGKTVAFSMGDELNSSTFLVHIEKAYPDINGAYSTVNREFVRNNADGYEFINREDDAGDEGLRKAKLSYRPCRIITKFRAEEIGI